MKVQIRHSVFETNSSSTHSLTMCTKSDFEKWKNGDLVFYGSFGYGGDLITKEELEQKKSHRWFDESEVRTYNDFMYCEFETFEESYITPSGETVVAFGAYGYDC